MKNTGFLRGLGAAVGKMATFGSTKDIGSKPAAAQPRAEAKPKAPTSAVTPAAQAPTAEPASSPAAPTPAEPKALHQFLFKRHKGRLQVLNLRLAPLLLHLWNQKPLHLFLSPIRCSQKIKNQKALKV